MHRAPHRFSGSGPTGDCCAILPRYVGRSIDPLKFETLAVAAARCLGSPGAKAERVCRASPLSQRQMRAIALHVNEHLGSVMTLEEMARVVATSPFHFAKRFKATTGTSPYAYVVAQRMIRSMQLLRTGQLTIARVARAVGYSDPRHFRRQFIAHWNQTPGGSWDFWLRPRALCACSPPAAKALLITAAAAARSW